MTSDGNDDLFLALGCLEGKIWKEISGRKPASVVLDAFSDAGTASR